LTQGNFKDNGDIDTNQPARLCTEKYYAIENYTKVTTTSNYKVWMIYYNDQKQRINQSTAGWHDPGVVNLDNPPEGTKYFRLILSRPDGSENGRRINTTNIPKNAVILTKK
jgi:hypothetical protein